MRTTQTLVDEFAAAIAGPVRPAGDAIPSFQTGLVHRPAVVVEPLDSSDVAALLPVAHRRNLPLTVHATGHGLRAPADGGVLVATRRMAAVRIDPAQRLARIGAGARWAEVLAAAARHGLRPAAGSAPSVGVAGYLFGGGLGLTARTDGWTADHVRSIELVDAAGAVRTVDAGDPERFARLRGTGPADGEIVTEVTLGLLPAGPLTGGGLVRVLGPADEPATDPGALHAWLDWTRDLPTDVTSGLSLVPYPDLPFLPADLRGRRVLRVAVVVCGDGARADAVLAPLRAAVAADEDTIGPLQPSGIGRVHAEPQSPHAYLGDDLLLSDVEGAGLDRVAARTGPMVVTGIRHLGGAAGRAAVVPDSVPGRDASYLVGALAPFGSGSGPEVVGAGPARSEVDGVLAGFARHATGRHPSFRFGPAAPGARW